MKPKNAFSIIVNQSDVIAYTYSISLSMTSLVSNAKSLYNILLKVNNNV